MNHPYPTKYTLRLDDDSARLLGVLAMNHPEQSRTAYATALFTRAIADEAARTFNTEQDPSLSPDLMTQLEDRLPDMVEQALIRVLPNALKKVLRPSGVRPAGRTPDTDKTHTRRPQGTSSHRPTRGQVDEDS